MRTFLLLMSVIALSCMWTENTADSGFKLRSGLLVDAVADRYNPPSMEIGDPEKYYWPKAIARFEKYGISDSAANSWIDALKNRSPFHFTLTGMARLMALYPDAPAIKNNRVVLLQKVFERDDSHNPWTSEGTENHINMDRTSGYLFAQYALEYPELFPEASGKLLLMKEWIRRWSATLYRSGSGEWNSDIYQAYHIIGWLNLFDFAFDEEVRDIARAVLDYYSSEMALHYSWGTYGGSMKRGRGVTDMNTTASNYLCWLWFGAQSDSLPGVTRGGEYIQSMHAVTSSYFPGEPIILLAAKEFPKPAWYMNSKPSYLFEYDSFVKQFFYIGRNYTLGAAVSPYGGWTGSTYQIMNWKLVIRNKSGNPFEISGNGRFHDTWTGITANPWTQFAQYKNVLVQLTMTPVNKEKLISIVRDRVDQWKKDWQSDFSSRFPEDDKNNVVNFARNIVAENKSFINLPAYSEPVVDNNKFFLQLGEVYLAVNFIGAYQTFNDDHIGAAGNRILITDESPLGNICGFVMEVVESERFDDIDDFIEKYNQKDRIIRMGTLNKPHIRYHSIDGSLIETGYSVSGCFSEAVYDWGYGVNEPQTFTFAAPFMQPEWPCGEGFGKIPHFAVNNGRVDFKEVWPVFTGPHFSLKYGILKIDIGGLSYRVDYSGSKPLFFE